MFDKIFFLLNNYCLTQQNVIRSHIISGMNISDNAVLHFCETLNQLRIEIETDCLTVNLNALLNKANNIFKGYMWENQKLIKFIDSTHWFEFVDMMCDKFGLYLEDNKVDGLTFYGNFKLDSMDLITEPTNGYTFINYCLNNWR